tara:strand:- start:2869 stop:3288 length:420 start_codon:yes stop_codon:yes gene_type:complete
MKTITFFLIIMALIFTSNTFAGLTQPAEVSVDMDNRTAQGDMNTARTSESEFTFIGCGIRRTVNGTDVLTFGFCQASAGESEDGAITCFTQNEALLESINSLSDYSFITFSWDENNDCTRIGNSTQSFYLPNLKQKKNK